MEYSVGSLADLISGQNTPNKPKLIAKSFKTTTRKLPQNDSEKTAEKPKKKSRRQLDDTSDSSPAKKVKLNESNAANDSSITEKPKKKSRRKKSQLDDTLDSSPNKNESNAENDSKIAERKKKSRGKRQLDDRSDSSPANKNESNAANRIKNKFNREIKTSPDYTENTLFVGNIPLQVTKEEVRKHFRKYGEIRSVRIRGIPVADPKTPKRIAAIRKEYHPDRKSVLAYVKFKNGADAKAAEAENGRLFFGHHLRVHQCAEKKNHDQSRAIFVGNLPFRAEEEELWNAFKSCGPIAHIRIVRDGRTGMGKGFAYVNFQDADSVQLALEMGTFTLQGRELRVTFCETNPTKKKKTGQNQEQNGGIKKEKVGFAGTKFTDKKKKQKSRKTTTKKRILAQKLAAKPAKIAV